MLVIKKMQDFNYKEQTDIENMYEINSIDDFYQNNEVQGLDLLPIEYFKNDCRKWCFNYWNNEYLIKDFSVIYNIVSCLPLTNLEKNLILVRFRRINLYCLKNFKSLSNYYTKSKLFMIICGIINPSLLSINHNTTTEYYNYLFWTVWTLQIMVSLITSFISFYKWDKKYFLYNSYKSRVNQEIWYYLELTGKYGKSMISNDIESKRNILTEANHKNKLSYFLENIESLFRKLKDYDLEIENNNDENNKDSTNKMKFIKSVVDNKNTTSPSDKEDLNSDILFKNKADFTPIVNKEVNVSEEVKIVKENEVHTDDKNNNV